MCVCVCPQDKTQTAEIKTNKLGTGTAQVSSRYLAQQLILGQKVKGKGHKVQKHIEGDQVAGVSCAFYRVPTL